MRSTNNRYALSLVAHALPRVASHKGTTSVPMYPDLHSEMASGNPMPACGPGRVALRRWQHRNEAEAAPHGSGGGLIDGRSILTGPVCREITLPSRFQPFLLPPFHTSLLPSMLRAFLPPHYIRYSGAVRLPIHVGGGSLQMVKPGGILRSLLGGLDLASQLGGELDSSSA